MLVHQVDVVIVGGDGSSSICVGGGPVERVAAVPKLRHKARHEHVISFIGGDEQHTYRMIIENLPWYHVCSGVLVL